MNDNQQKSRENERALIGAVMRDGDIYSQAREVVQVASFDWQPYGAAWSACETLFTKGMKIDTITVGDELERAGKLAEFATEDGQYHGRAALSKLREIGNPRNFLSYAENINDYALKRTLEPFFLRCAQWSQNGRRGKDILSDVHTELGKITVHSAQDEYTAPISTAISEAYDWTGAMAEGKIVGVPTGLIDLDRVLGSLIAGNVYLVAGRPGTGKTGLLLTIARNAAKLHQKRVALFSLEMSRMQVGQRLISQEAEIDLSNIIHGKLRENEWPLYTHAVEEISSWPIVINDLSNINTNQIRQTARRIKANGGLDLLILDYIQLAESGEKSRERRELDVSNVSRGLKYLARELDIPILAAAQLNRAVEARASKKPILSDLRESGSLEQDAYAVGFLYREDEEQQNIMTLDIAKHRNGPTGACEFIFRAPFVRFDDAVTKVFNLNPRKDIE